VKGSFTRHGYEENHERVEQVSRERHPAKRSQVLGVQQRRDEILRREGDISMTDQKHEVVNSPFFMFVDPARIRKQIGSAHSDLPKAGNSSDTQKLSDTR
jgi:hypothetical protein